jgi:exopolysaccharide biosynthesis polyprenyl glycosylphosphotransferase
MMTHDSVEHAVISKSGKRRMRAHVRWGTAFGETPATAVIWAVLDFLSAIVAGLIAFRVRLGPQPEPLAGGVILRHLEETAPLDSFAHLLVFAVYLVLFVRLYGLYRMNFTRSFLNEQRLTLQATLTAALMLCGTLYVMHSLEIPRAVLGLTVVLTLTMIMGRRMVWRTLQERRFLSGQETRNVMIVGDGRIGQALRNHLESLPHMGFRFIGFVSLDPEQESNNPQVIGDISNCVTIARSLFVDEIYFSVPTEKQRVIGVVEQARALGIEVRVVPDMYDGLAWNAPVEFIGQFPTISLNRRDFPASAFLLKRVIDIAVSSVALMLLLPFFAIAGVVIKLDSPGTVFYSSKRIGRKGRTFRCFKLRTMKQDADKMRHELAHLNERDGILFKVSNDPRVTRLGALLRKYSLDELPQFFNVLIGDMSLVGPRPPLEAEVEKYDIAHLRRLDVLPGMTGLWQVEARQDPSFDSYISLDTAYVENWNLLLDARILLRTVGVVLSGTGS